MLGHATPVGLGYLQVGVLAKNARLRPRSAPGPLCSSAPLRGRAVSRRVREDESYATTFVASTHVRVQWLGL